MADPAHRVAGAGVAARPRHNSLPALAAQPSLPDPQTFEAVVALIGEKREIALQMDVQRYVRPVSFKPGTLTYEPVDGAPANLATRLSSRLKDWTGRPWFVVANGQGGGETLIEQEKKATASLRAEVEADPFVRAVLEAFPGAVVGEIKTLAPAVEMPAIPDEIDDDQD